MKILKLALEEEEFEARVWQNPYNNYTGVLISTWDTGNHESASAYLSARQARRLAAWLVDAADNIELGEASGKDA